MEVFFSNVANEASEDDIIIAVAAVLHSPPFATGSEPCNFSVKRFSTNRNGTRRTNAIVTIPDAHLAHKLLYRYGGQSPQATFKVCNRTIYMKQSEGGRNKGELDQTFLHHLRTTPFVNPSSKAAEKNALDALAAPIPFVGIQFGRLGKDDTFSIEYSKTFNNGQIIFLGDKRAVSLSWSSQSQNSLLDMMSAKMEVRMPFSSVTSMLSVAGSTPSIILSLSRPPTYEVVRSFLFALDVGEGRQRLDSLDAEHAAIAPFVDRTIRIIFGSTAQHDEFSRRRRLVRLPRVINGQTRVSERSRYSKHSLNKVRSFMANQDIRVAFQLELLLSNGFLDPIELLALFPDVQELSETRSPPTLERILQKLVARLLSSTTESWRYDDSYGSGDWYDEDEEELENQQRPFAQLTQLARASSRPATSVSKETVVDQLREIASRTRQGYSEAGQDGQEMLGRHVVLTPSGIRLEGPFPDQSNRILRQYGQHEFFVRVSIRDEDFNKHRQDPQNRGDFAVFLRKRYLPFFLRGIEIGGRKFEFLSYSSSALRDHLTWFVAPFTDANEAIPTDLMINAAVIRKGMGDFSKVIHIPARYMARLAQAFSATQPSITLKASEIRRIADLYADNCSLLSDGIGSISLELAEEVEVMLTANLSDRDRRRRVRPSCYQFRLGGSKGMLAVDPKLIGRQVCIRPSQEKFEASSLTLDVAEAFTSPRPAFLNRPLIQILEALGVREKPLLHLQRQAVTDVEGSRHSARAVGKLLEQHGLGAAIHLPSTLRALSKILGIEIEASPTSVDPFASLAIDLAIVEALRSLKFCARIPVPDSWSLVGVLDEDGYLKEGEIYACIKRKGQRTIYLQGPLAISRSPTTHPADVQVVHAIGELPPGVAPRLREQVNCVVFASRGSIEVSAKHVKGTKCSNKVHIRESDFDKGLVLPDSQAVDFPKTGTAVSHATLPRPPPLKPDFTSPEWLAKRSVANHYQSTRVLGKLFRAIPLDDTIYHSPPRSAVVVLDPARTITNALQKLRMDGLPGARLGAPSKPLMAEFVDLMYPFADDLMYYARVNTLQHRNDRHLTEAEVFVGTVAAPSKDHRLRQDKISKLQEQTGSLFSAYRKEIEGYAGEEDPSEQSQLARVALRAWAAWYAAVEEDQDAYGVKTFGWLALGVLMEVLAEMNGDQ